VICSAYGRTRQGFYKHQRQARVACTRQILVLENVRKIRNRQKKVGTRKLHRMLNAMGDANLAVSRDKLFELLRRNDLLVKTRRKQIKTTDFNHDMPIYPNLLEAYIPTGVNQAWVVDITYLTTCKGFAYLFLTTDLYSRKIISHVVADNLKAENACLVLNKALQTVGDPCNIIHHSDHGSQYCSKAYQNILIDNNLKHSMTGLNRCYDNAVAERVNGILKQEFGLDKTFPDIKIAMAATKDAIHIYNTERLHVSLGYKTPDSVYLAAA
jgi:transposase InsO family protein